MMTLAGLFNPDARAAKEMLYLLNEPFVVDSKRFQETFGLAPTPVETGLKRTLDWYRQSLKRDV
jgi:nucleoside-diphosphate-sugar epimerase